MPERMCIGCRKKAAKKDLIRIIAKDAQIVIDRKGNTLARGTYICRSADCVALAKKKKALSRQLRQNVPDEVYDEIIKELSNG